MMVDAGGTAALITAFSGLLAGASVAAKFMWNKIEARFDAIDGKLAACEAREKGALERHSSHVTVIELLWQEVERLSPDGSKALTRALKLVSDLKNEGG